MKKIDAFRTELWREPGYGSVEASIRKFTPPGSSECGELALEDTESEENETQSSLFYTFNRTTGERMLMALKYILGANKVERTDIHFSEEEGWHVDVLWGEYAFQIKAAPPGEHSKTWLEALDALLGR